MNYRVAKLRNLQRNCRPSLSAERIVLATEAAQKYAGEQVYLYRAHIFAHVLDHKAIVIREGELLAGSLTEQIRAAAVFPEYQSGRIWLREELPSMPTRSTDPFQITPEDMKTILECLDYWDGRSVEDMMAQTMPREILDCEDAGVFKSGGRYICSGCISANFERMLSLGFGGHIDICRNLIKDASAGYVDIETQRKIFYWKATIIVLEAMIRYAHRCADKAQELAAQELEPSRKAELEEMARICRKVPEFPPETFHEAVQFQWFLHLGMDMESNSVATSLGRFDQHLYKYYVNDLKEGRIDRERATELVELLFLKVDTLFILVDNWYARANAGLPMWQVLHIGGLTADGEDACNELTEIVLDATEEMKLAQPAVALRVNEKTAQKVMRKAIKMNQQGLGNPAFFGDAAAMKTVVNKGAKPEDAWNWTICGCVETHPGGGVSDGSPIGGYMSSPKCLEIALHNGFDPLTGKQIGLKTGDPRTFTCRQDLVEAVKKQIAHFQTFHARAQDFTQSTHALTMPQMYMSVALDGCIEQAKSVQEGGPELCFTNLFIAGAGTTGDSIAAIDQAVFQDKKLTMDELIAICDANFEGNEPLRQYLINKPLKYGNNIKEIDDMVADIMEHACLHFQTLPETRGGRFSCGVASQNQNVALGVYTGATPDGRRAYTTFSDNASPTMGRDTSGPTAAANSVLSIHPENCHGGVLYNIRFDPKGVAGEKGIDILEGVVKSFCCDGGIHIQMNVVDNETLRKAQEDPENYRDLVVRVSGYLAYFTELDRLVQEAIIERTVHLS